MSSAPDRPRLLFVNRFYWPDETATAQLLTDLAEALADRGWDVQVITSARPSSPARERRRGVDIARTAGTRASGRGLKARDFASFYLRACRLLFHQARPGDVVIALTDPPLLGIGAALVARLRRSHLVHWIQDIYPEVAIAVSGRRALGIFRPWRDAAWRQSAACVTLGADMAAVVASAGVPGERIGVIANWAPAGLGPADPAAAAAWRRAAEPAAEFLVAYSGNLGRVHDVEAILDLAAAMREDPGVRFLCVGDGARRAPAEAAAARRGLHNLRFLPPQPREILAPSLAAADVHLVSLLPGCEPYVFPSKIAGLAATGCPVLFIGSASSEPARLVREAGFGRAFAPGQTGEMRQWLLDLRAGPNQRARLRAAALAFAQAGGGVDRAADRWERILRAAGASAPESASTLP